MTDTSSNDSHSALDMAPEDIIAYLERIPIKEQQCKYINGLMPSIWDTSELYRNILTMQHYRLMWYPLMLWPHQPRYELYMDDMDPQYEYTPFQAPLFKSIDTSHIHYVLNKVHNMYIMIKEYNAQNIRPLDAIDVLYCFILLLGHVPSKYIQLHVSRHFRVDKTHQAWQTIQDMTQALREERAYQHTDRLVPYMYKCLKIQTLTVHPIDRYDQ